MGRKTLSPVTSTMYSVKPNPPRPVGVTTGEFVVPLAIKVPAFPSEVPGRNFPVRAGNIVPFNGKRIIREDGRHMPSQGGGHIEIIIDSGLGDNGVSLV